MVTTQIHVCSQVLSFTYNSATAGMTSRPIVSMGVMSAFAYSVLLLPALRFGVGCPIIYARLEGDAGRAVLTDIHVVAVHRLLGVVG